MVNKTVKNLESQALSPVEVKVVGNYTDPKTWGVYRIAQTGGSGQSFHLGNHPVRQFELERKHGSAELLMLFTEREDAVRLKQLLSSGAALVGEDA